jgi:hypothetical protein
VLRVVLPTALRSGIASVRVRLLQGSQAAISLFGLRAKAGASTLAPGVTASGPGFLLLMGPSKAAALRGAWVAAAPASLLVEARSTAETVRYRHAGTIRFRTAVRPGSCVARYAAVASVTAADAVRG